MELKDKLSIEELDRLFDNGFSYQDYLNASPFVKIMMLGKKAEDKFKLFNHTFKIKEIDGWQKIGEGENREVYIKDNIIFIGMLN